jgi:hypothetical protein
MRDEREQLTLSLAGARAPRPTTRRGRVPERLAAAPRPGTVDVEALKPGLGDALRAALRLVEIEQRNVARPTSRDGEA